MADPALSIFQSLNHYEDIQSLIDNGDAEGIHLESKAPSGPQLGRDLKTQLAQAVSGFSNTSGGVILWGVSTTKHAHSGLDILTQIEPIGNCRQLAQQIDRAITTIANPFVVSSPSKVLHRSKSDTKGVVITYIPQTDGDPVQSTLDQKFYLRTGDSFSIMPYEVLKRMFAGTAGPDVRPNFNRRLVTMNQDKVWKIPILLENFSSAIAEHTIATVEILNPQACQSIEATSFRDVSTFNPGQRIFMTAELKPLYRGLESIVGEINVSMKTGRRPKRILGLRGFEWVELSG